MKTSKRRCERWATLVRAGKIRYWAVSNFRGWRIAEIAPAVRTSSACRARWSASRTTTCSTACRKWRSCPHANTMSLGVVPYSPVARGVLTGKYQPGQAPASDTRAGRADRRMMQTEFREESLVIAQQLKVHAEARGLTPGQFATAWVLANPIITSVIAGPRTLAQFEDYFGAMNVIISQEEEAMVDALVTPGHASTHGYNDPNYPFGGRPVRVPGTPSA
ncbi:aldo/keto reductase [Cupriavidus basilensis]